MATNDKRTIVLCEKLSRNNGPFLDTRDAARWCFSFLWSWRLDSSCTAFSRSWVSASPAPRHVTLNGLTGQWSWYIWVWTVLPDIIKFLIFSTFSMASVDLLVLGMFWSSRHRLFEGIPVNRQAISILATSPKTGRTLIFEPPSVPTPVVHS